MELNEELKIFSGRANRQLAQKIAEYLGITLGEMEVRSFSDGEIYVKINENVRGRDVFLVQPTSPPVNENLMELLIMIDACQRASAQRITAVVPYYGYARQDRKDQPRVPITAKLVANLITKAGTDRILTLDLHVDQIQGFFDIKVDHLFAAPVIIDYFRKKKLDNLTVLSPDVGGLRRARAYARALKVPLAIVDKRRPTANEAEIIHIVGEVKGRQILIIDDMVDTGGTLLAAVNILMEKGAVGVYAACTHPVLSGNAYQKIENSPLKELVVTDTIPLDLSKSTDKIKVLSVAPLLGEAIKRIHQNKSVSSLFYIK
ncbi:MAG TPA: ribose-phosphate pyrophosphokinase [Candidatus Aerophobetes bacterium]|uniref:Ribose-phosphate pyrophosphokinase n=2 Tax=Aerophobetes bacterium TaxID=2030807 RepID=A0A7V0MZN1_UNCAE|nr:ribose-phosphate pyrophosphokinase [Candidatus Aerophobetes bacterium]